MQIYKSKSLIIPGTSLGEVIKTARKQYHTIQKRTPRRVPYVRSKYFTKDKIFINSFWDHANQKSPKDRVRRIKLFPCAIEIIRNSPLAPDTVQNPNNPDESLHRFYGQSADGIFFTVQIKENKKTGRKDFISVFPVKKIRPLAV
jgi:hypothetical protein